MLYLHSAITIIIVIGLAGSGTDTLSVVCVSLLGAALFVVGTLWRRKLSRSEETQKPRLNPSRIQSVPVASERGNVHSERSPRQASVA